MLTMSTADFSICLPSEQVRGFICYPKDRLIELLLHNPVFITRADEGSNDQRLILSFSNGDSYLTATVDLSDLIATAEAGGSNEWDFDCMNIEGHQRH